MENLRFVWITRDVSSISQIFPDLETLWNDLCDAWGIDGARQFTEISIHCTCNDNKTQLELEKEFEDFNLFREGALKFERPLIQDIITKQSMKRINDESLKASHTLFVFCGSSAFASTIKHNKLMNDVALLMADKSEHHTDLVVECYDGHFNAKQRDLNDDTPENRKHSIKFSLSPKSTLEFGIDTGKMF